MPGTQMTLVVVGKGLVEMTFNKHRGQNWVLSVYVCGQLPMELPSPSTGGQRKGTSFDELWPQDKHGRQARSGKTRKPKKCGSDFFLHKDGGHLKDDGPSKSTPRNVFNKKGCWMLRRVHFIFRYTMA